MLVFAFALVIFALANVGFTLKGKLPAGAVVYIAVYMAIVLLAHLAVRRFAPWADPLLLPLAALLNGLSIVMMDRLSAQVNPATGHPAIGASQANLQIAFSAVGIGCFVAVLIFESDIGTSAVFMGLFVVMLYIATSRTSWLLIGFLMFVAGAFLAGTLVSHVHERFDIWLHPFTAANVQGNAYQLVQGLYGMASGGLLGKGLGGGQPYITPLVQSDLVFTAFGEEIGLAGLMAILLIYGLIVQRGLRAAISVKDPFSKLLAGGLSFMLALQVFVIVGGVTRLIPLTGITTPFLSQGGSSLVASWMLIAVLGRISDSARRPPPRPIQEEGLTQVVTLK